MWNEKQALAAQWKVNLQALASCDSENGQEFDLSLEEADERFVRLNELIRAYMQARKIKMQQMIQRKRHRNGTVSYVQQ